MSMPRMLYAGSLVAKASGKRPGPACMSHALRICPHADTLESAMLQQHVPPNGVRGGQTTWQLGTKGSPQPMSIAKGLPACLYMLSQLSGGIGTCSQRLKVKIMPAAPDSHFVCRLVSFLPVVSG